METADEFSLGVAESAKMMRRAASAHPDPKEAEEIANAPLERDKFRLLASVNKDTRALAELEERIAGAQAELLARKQALSQANALFLTMGPEAATRAPSQRIGANN